MNESPDSYIIRELIYQRIKIALAVAVIKSKPGNLSIEEHATQVQCRYKQRSCCQLVMQEPGTYGTNLSSGDMRPDAGVGSSGDEDHYDDEAESSLELIQAVVQLQCSVSASSSMPLEDRRRLMSLLHSEDSGVDTDVSPCAVQYMLRGTDVDDQLRRAVGAVLVYVERASADGEWKGSMLQCATSLLVQLVDSGQGEGECRTACSRFLCRVLDGIAGQGEQQPRGDFTALETCCIPVVEMCNSRYLSADVIEHLVDHITSRSRELRPPSASEDCRPDTEFYLFHVLELVLRKYNRLRRRGTGGADGTRKSSYSDVLERWKASWRVHDDRSHRTDRPEERTAVWGSKLEESAVNSTSINPYFALYAWRCRSLLED